MKLEPGGGKDAENAPDLIDAGVLPWSTIKERFVQREYHEQSAYFREMVTYRQREHAKHFVRQAAAAVRQDARSLLLSPNTPASACSQSVA